jgi:hypothetical protein
MPLVHVKRSSENVSYAVITEIISSIPEMVAKHLTVESRPEARLTAKDVSVHFSEKHEFDIMTSDVEIVVQANFYKERSEGLDDKARWIVHDICEAAKISSLKISVWIQLGYGGYFATL